MIAVPNTWKNQYDGALVNESFVEIDVGFYDADALTGYTFDASGMEREGAIPRDGYLAVGYRTTVLSGQNGDFSSTIPTLYIYYIYPKTTLISGITVIFDQANEQYATDFSVKAYNGTTLMAEKAVTGNKKSVCFVDVDMVGYNRVEIAITRWSKPSVLARIGYIMFGFVKTYTKSDLMRYEHEIASDPVGSSLPSSKITFSIDNTDNKFDLDSGEGDATYLATRQKLTVRYGNKADNGDITMILAGVFYLSEWEIPFGGVQCTFTARDITYFLEGPFRAGLYRSEGISLYDLANEVFSYGNIPSGRKIVLSDSLKNITTTAPIPICSVVQALQYIAQAGRCIMFVDRNGDLNIKPSSEIATDYDISSFNELEKPEIEFSQIVSSVDVKTYTYEQGQGQHDLFSGAIPGNGQAEYRWIEYSEPATNVQATITDGSLGPVQYFTHACYILYAGNANTKITIVGTPLKTSSSSTTVSNGTDGAVQPVDNPLISSASMATDVANWVNMWAGRRKKLTIPSYRSLPSLDAGDTITAETKNNEKTVLTSRVKYTFTGAFRGTMEGRVIE